MRFFPLALAVAVVPACLHAQQPGPRTDTLLARVERGDSAAFHQLEPSGWAWIKTVADKGRLDPASARAMARTMLALASPIPTLDVPTTDRDRIWRSAAVNALEMALAKDSGDVWSASQLEQIAPYPYIWMDPDKELVALRALLARHRDLPPTLLLTRVRLELERGSADSALAWLTALPDGAVSPAARGHIAAEADFARGKATDAATAYYDGAAAIRDSNDAAWYSRDLAWIARPDELSEWNALAPAAREPWLEKFWNRRDIEDGQLPGARLPEQFRRWRVALRKYRWEYDGSTAKGIIIPRSDGTEYRPALVIGTGDARFPKDPTVAGVAYLNRMRPLTLVLDDRGGMILRHGEPAQTVNMPGITGLQEETDRWNTSGGPLIVSFSRMADSLFPRDTILNGVMPSQRFGMVARNYPAGELMANCEVDPRLCVLAAKVIAEGSASAATLAYGNTIHQDFTQMRITAEHTDGNPESFNKQFDAIVEVYGIPDRGALVVFALPVKQLVVNDAARARTTDFAARLRVVAGDRQGGAFAGVLDTVRSWALRVPVTDSTQLTGFVLVPTNAGTLSVAVTLSDLTRAVGVATRINAIPVEAFEGKRLQLSDLILGSNSSGLAWANDGQRIPLNPQNAWRPDEPAVLTYQLDGLVPGHSYETRIELWDAAGKPATYRNSVAFTAQAAEVRATVQREVALQQLGPGDYRLVVRVRDITTGTEVQREQRLAVRKG